MSMEAIRIFTALASAAFLAAGCATAPGGGPVTAFTGATVLPMTDGAPVLRDQTVIVAGERIAAAGAKVRVPRGATVIDARGLTILPGLADMHVHLEYVEDPDILKLFVASGVTTVRSMDGRPFILDWRAQVEAGKIVGPRIVTAGPIIDGDPPLRDDNLAVATPDAASAAVKAQAAAGYDFIKLYDNLTPEAWRSAIAAASEAGLAVAGHVPRRVELAEALAAQASVEHLSPFGDAIDAQAPGARWSWTNLYLAQSATPETLAAAAALAAAGGAAVTPTLLERDRSVGTERDLAEWRADPRLALLPQEAVGAWTGALSGRAAQLDDADLKLLAKGRANRLALVRALHDAGARLLIGTDTPNPFVIPGASVAEEIALFVEAGVPPLDALRYATKGAADFLGDKEGGEIAPGKRADFILVAGDPLADVSVIKAPAGVVRRGEYLSREELDRLSRDLAAP